VKENKENHTDGGRRPQLTVFELCAEWGIIDPRIMGSTGTGRAAA